MVGLCNARFIRLSALFLQALCLALYVYLGGLKCSIFIIILIIIIIIIIIFIIIIAISIRSPVSRRNIQSYN